MSFWNWLSRLKIPKMPSPKDVFEVPQQIKEEAYKLDANLLNVKYFSQDGTFVTDTIARIRRDTEYEIAYCRVPEPLGFIILPGGKKFNTTTKKTEIYLIEGYCASLVMKEYYDKKIEEKEHNDLASGLVGKEGYHVPILPEDLPHIKTTVRIGDNDVDIIPKTIAQMGTSKWMEGITEKKIDGVAVIMILGICIGFVLSSLLNAFARGG